MLKRPNIAVVDREENLALTTQRYELSDESLPFMEELERDLTLSFIAHALVRGPKSPADIFSLDTAHPLRTNPLAGDQWGLFRGLESPGILGLIGLVRNASQIRAR